LLAAAPASAADEIHWTMTSPTSVTVDWRGPSPILRYGVTSNYHRTAVAHPPAIEPFSSTGPFWEARIKGLQPGTSYHYSIDGGPDHVFHGTPGPGSRFTVYVEGDVGSSIAYRTVAPVQSLIADGAPTFVLVVGDLSYANSYGLAAVDQHFNDVMTWSQDAAYMPIWGNHDWSSTGDDLRNYKGRFDLPNGRSSPGSPLVSCCGQDWYWFDAGNTRFIAFPEPYSGAWAAWYEGAKGLMSQAEANSAIHFIVTFGHRPSYSSGNHAGLETIRGMLDSLGANYPKYVLNLTGHSHDYERTTPQFGVTHVTVGTGGATLEADTGACAWSGGCPPPAWSAYRALHHGALRLDFDPYSIHGVMLCGPPARHNDVTCGTGEALDSFTLGGDTAPIFANVPGNLSVAVGALVTLDVNVSDPNGDVIQSLTADLSRLTAGSNATFTVGPGDTSSKFQWTPQASDIGSNVVTFAATNALTTSASTVIDVKAVLDAPATHLPGLALDDVRPNPAGSVVTLSYAVDAGATPRLELLDVVGRVVHRLDQAPLDPGRHVSAWTTPALLPAGVYWLRLSQSGHSVIRTVVIRH
jgi:hypothetical protein